MMLVFGTHSQIEFRIQAGASLGSFRSSSLGQVCEVYNLNNQGVLDKALKAPGIGYGYDLRLDCSIGKLFLAFGRTWLTSSSNTDLITGSKRFINVENQYYNALIGYQNGGVGQKIIVASGISVNNSLFSSYMKYTTGDRDYTYGSLSGYYGSVGFGVPMMIQYNRNVSANWQVIVQLQFQLISATKFSYFDNTTNGSFSSSGLTYYGIDVLNDAKYSVLTIGLSRSIFE